MDDLARVRDTIAQSKSFREGPSDVDTRTGDVINNWRTKTLNLEALGSSEGPKLLKTLQIPHTYCWSPALVPRPSDWPEHIGMHLLQTHCECFGY